MEPTNPNTILLIILLSGLTLFIVFLLVVSAVRRAGEKTAASRLGRLSKIPFALLNFFKNYDPATAFAVLTAEIADALSASGAQAFTYVGQAQPTSTIRAGDFKLTRVHGPLFEHSDVDVKDLQGDLSPLGEALSREENYFEVDSRDFPRQFRRAFPGVKTLLYLKIRVQQPSKAVSRLIYGILVFYLEQRSVFDQGIRETMLDITIQIPQIFELVSSKLQRTADLEDEFDRAQQSDEILRQMILGHQHDLAHSLGAVSQKAANLSRVVDDPRIKKEIIELKSLIVLTAKVANSGALFTDLVQRKTPVGGIALHDPFNLIDEAIRPLLNLRSSLRPELIVNLKVDDDLPMIRADQVALFRAVGNVINNAFKYTQEGGINVFIRGTADKEQVIISVADTGRGIPEDDLALIGQQQFRAKNVDDQPGSGIGLWITRQLVESMEGGFEIDSKEGRGTICKITLPAEQRWLGDDE